MKKNKNKLRICYHSLSVAALISLTMATANAATVVVNTVDNTDFGTGKTNLVRAINTAAAGDTIGFNISGAGPHRLLTPAGGYPVISNHNVTIDGYTQPGALPNSNTILSSNIARIKIILDSTSGNGTSNPGTGFGADEWGTLFVTGTNCHIRGLSLLGPGRDFTDGNSHYGVCVGADTINTHVSGCWIGLDPDGVTVRPHDDGVAAFGGGTTFPLGTIIGVAKGPANTAAARAQFNIFCGNYINVILEGKETRLSGNFWNVLPDGLHDLSQDLFPMETQIELGRGGNNLVIGTDGDGLNDAEERNVIGGVTASGDQNIIEHYGGGSNPGAARTNMIIAGNYIGMGVDGTTRFTNAMRIIDSLDGSSTLQFGSDFNGVSDAIEGNVISMNHPFDTLFPDPLAVLPRVFSNFSPGARVSFRGNLLIGNNLPPYTYANDSGGLLAGFTNYYLPFISTNGILIPVLTNSTAARLIGNCGAGAGIYTNIIIDVYLADREGWTNGMKFAISELIVDGVTNGFPQGKTYLGSFLDNGPADSNPAVGSFDLNISSLSLSSGAFVTVSASYSADPIGTTRGRTHTSNFANPWTLTTAVTITITSITRSGTTLTITWTGGSGPYTLQRKSPITGTWGNVTTGIVGNSTTATVTGTEGYYQIVSP